MKLADNAELRQQMSNNGRLLAEREYSWAGIAERWLAGLQSANDFNPEAGEAQNDVALRVAVRSRR